MLASGDGTVDLNIDNGTFVVDVSTSRVGIGAAPTDGTLHVQTASAGTVAASTQADDIVIENNAEGGMTIITPDDQSARIRFTSPSTNGEVGGAHVFYRQNINKMQVGTAVSGGVLSLASGASNDTMLLDGSGNVGIGRTSITQPSSGATTLAIQGTATTKGGAIRLYSSDDSVAAYIYPDNSSGLSINTSTSHPIVFRTVGTERMRIDSSGNVGIGTSSINSFSGYTTLEINNATSGALLDLSQGDSMRGRLVATATTMSLETSGSIPIIFQPAGTERMRIDSSGNLGIGTTSPATAPSGAFTWANSLATIAGTRPVLYLNGSSSITTLRMWPNGTDGASTSVDDWHVNTSAGGVSTGRLSFTPQGGAIANIGLHLKPDGKVGIGTYTPTANLEVVDPVSGNFAGKIHIGGTGSGRRLVLEQSDVLTYKMGGTGTNSITQLVSGGSSGVGTVRMTIDENGVTTFNSSVTATALTLNTSATSSFSIVNGGTNAVAIKSAAGDELYIGANNTYALRLLNDGTNNVVMDNGGNLGVVGTATTANQARISVGAAAGAKAGVLNINSSSTSNAGGIRHRMAGGTQYLNIASTQTASGTIPYWHIKTNAYYNQNVMFVARVHGYAYGNSGHIIDMQRSGYAYSGSSSTVIASQFANNGTFASASLNPYYTSAGQLCFRAYGGASSYYTGWAFDMKMQSPTGYNFDFVIIEHVMNATSGNHY